MKRALLLLSLAAIPFVTSCQSGPKRLTRSWDGYVNQRYVEHSLIHGALLQDILPVYPIVGFFAALGDWFILNPYYFWSRDAWDQNGTAFDYTDADGAENTVGKWPTKKMM